MRAIRCPGCNRVFLPEEIQGQCCPACRGSLAGGAGLESASPAASSQVASRFQPFLFAIAVIFPALLAIGIFILSRSNTSVPPVAGISASNAAPERATERGKAPASNVAALTPAGNQLESPELAQGTPEKTTPATVAPASLTVAPKQKTTIQSPEAGALRATGKELEIGLAKGLVLHLSSGSIAVITGETDKLQVQAISENPAAAEANRQLSIVPEGSRIRIQPPPAASRGVCYRVLAPRKFNLDLKTTAGEITITNLEGNVTVASTEGRINIAKVQGAVTAESPGGSIALLSASGPVRMKTAGGHITIGEAGAESSLETSGGSIKVLLARGPLRAKTGGGGIKVGAAFNSVRATSTSGSMSACFFGQPKSNSAMVTVAGSLEVKVAPQLRFEIHARSLAGKVFPELPVNWDINKQTKLVKGVFNGSGPRLAIRTSAGTIWVKPLGQTPLPSLEKDFEFFTDFNIRSARTLTKPLPNAFALPDNSAPKLAPGLLLADGNWMPAEVAGLDETQVLVRLPDGASESFLLSKVKVLLFHAMPEAKRSALLRNAAGLLLRNGDYVEGAAKGIRENQLIISSPVHGLKSYSLEREAMALFLAPNQ